jgi:hypothetical protein
MPYIQLPHELQRTLGCQRLEYSNATLRGRDDGRNWTLRQLILEECSIEPEGTSDVLHRAMPRVHARPAVLQRARQRSRAHARAHTRAALLRGGA